MLSVVVLLGAALCFRCATSCPRDCACIGTLISCSGTELDIVDVPSVWSWRTVWLSSARLGVEFECDRFLFAVDVGQEWNIDSPGPMLCDVLAPCLDVMNATLFCEGRLVNASTIGPSGGSTTTQRPNPTTSPRPRTIRPKTTSPRPKTTRKPTTTPSTTSTTRRPPTTTTPRPPTTTTRRPKRTTRRPPTTTTRRPERTTARQPRRTTRPNNRRTTTINAQKSGAAGRARNRTKRSPGPGRVTCSYDVATTKDPPVESYRPRPIGPSATREPYRPRRPTRVWWTRPDRTKRTTPTVRPTYRTREQSDRPRQQPDRPTLNRTRAPKSAPRPNGTPRPVPNTTPPYGWVYEPTTDSTRKMTTPTPRWVFRPRTRPPITRNTLLPTRRPPITTVLVTPTTLGRRPRQRTTTWVPGTMRPKDWRPKDWVLRRRTTRPTTRREPPPTTTTSVVTTSERMARPRRPMHTLPPRRTLTYTAATTLPDRTSVTTATTTAAASVAESTVDTRPTSEETAPTTQSAHNTTEPADSSSEAVGNSKKWLMYIILVVVSTHFILWSIWSSIRCYLEKKTA